MLKNLLIAAAIMIVSPSLGFADDVFFAFGSGSTASDTSTTAANAGSGSVFIYSDADFAFDGLDIYFTNSDPNVIQFIGGEGLDEEFTAVGDFKFDSSEVSVPPTGNPPATVDGRFLAVNVTNNGVNPALGVLFDPLYDDAVPSASGNGAFLLARLDYEIIGAGTTDFTFSLGPNGAVQLENNPDFNPDNPDDPDNPSLLTTVLNPTFGSASLSVTAIPEPSSLTLLILGSVGMVARRKRA